MGLRVLKINDGVHNPAQAKPEGNLANVVISNLYNIGPSVAGIGGERETKEKEAEREYQGTDSGTYPTRLE